MDAPLWLDRLLPGDIYPPRRHEFRRNHPNINNLENQVFFVCSRVIAQSLAPAGCFQSLFMLIHLVVDKTCYVRVISCQYLALL
jgi:hypothetical protein